MLNNKGDKDGVWAEGMIRMLGVTQVKGKWCLQAKHMAGVENIPSGLISRREQSKINTELKCRRLDVFGTGRWRVEWRRILVWSSCEGIRSRTCYGVDARSLPRNFGSNKEREEGRAVGWRRPTTI